MKATAFARSQMAQPSRLHERWIVGGALAVLFLSLTVTPLRGVFRFGVPSGHDVTVFAIGGVALLGLEGHALGVQGPTLRDEVSRGVGLPGALGASRSTRSARPGSASRSRPRLTPRAMRRPSIAAQNHLCVA